MFGSWVVKLEYEDSVSIDLSLKTFFQSRVWVLGIHPHKKLKVIYTVDREHTEIFTSA